MPQPPIPSSPQGPRGTNRGIPLYSQFKGGESDTVREVPPEWRAALDILVIETPVPIDTEVVDLTSGVLAIKREQKNTGESTLRSTGTDTELPATLIERFTDKNKQFGTRTRLFHFIDDLPFVTEPTATIDVSTKNFGNKHFEETIEDVGDLFIGDRYERGRPDVTPPDFGALLETDEHCFRSVGIASDPSTPLPPGVLLHSDEQLDVFTHKECIKVIDSNALPAILVNKRTSRFKQVETVTRILEDDSTTPAVPTALRDVTFTKLGDGNAVEERVDVPSVFDNIRYDVLIPDVIPISFRALIPAYTTTKTEAGDASPPTPSEGTLSAFDEQTTEFEHRHAETTREFPELPVQLFGEAATSEFGGGVLDVIRTLDSGLLPAEYGLFVVSSESQELGNLMSTRETRQLQDAWKEADPNGDDAWPVIPSFDFNEEFQVHVTEERQVCDPATYTEPATGAGFIETLKGIDKFKTLRTRTTIPYTAVDESSAIISYKMAPYQFPGWMDFAIYLRPYIRKTHADLVLHKVKTWWETNDTPPTFDEIVMDNPIVANLNGTGAEYAGECLHDDYYFGTILFPATTPTATQYARGNVVGSTLRNVANISNPGSGYSVGDNLTISDGTHTKSVTVTSVGVSNSILGVSDDLSGNYPVGTYFGIAATGGSGTGAEFGITAFNEPIYDGDRWIGTERVIAGTSTPTKIPGLWKKQTETVVMR